MIRLLGLINICDTHILCFFIWGPRNKEPNLLIFWLIGGLKGLLISQGWRFFSLVFEVKPHLV